MSAESIHVDSYLNISGSYEWPDILLLEVVLWSLRCGVQTAVGGVEGRVGSFTAILI